jgi:hypothetical protein
MRSTTIIVVVSLVVAVIVLTHAIVRLENYRYANFVGFCTDFDIKDPQQRIKREACLNNTQTRTHWLFHVAYGVGLL